MSHPVAVAVGDEGETFTQKASRKLKEEPLIPIGLLATCAALTMASIKLRQGKSMDMNKWLRVRVGAQAFTVVAICGYAYRQGALRAQLAPDDRDEAKKAKKASDEFKERLKGAEEAFKAENAGTGVVDAVQQGKGNILGEVERVREEGRRASENLERVEKDGSVAGSEGVEAPARSGSSWKSWFGLGGGSGSGPRGKPS